MARLERTTTAPRIIDTSKLTIESAGAGLLGTLAATLFMAAMPVVGLTRVQLPSMIGRLMQGSGPDWVFAQLAGWAAYIVALTALAVGYGWMVKRVEPGTGVTTAVGFALTPWVFTNAVLFPLAGLGPFAMATHSPLLALETAAMFGIYALVMGLVLDRAVEHTSIPVIGLRESTV